MNNEMKKWEVRGVGGGGTSADKDIYVDARLHSDSVHCRHTLTPLDSRGRRC